jgi:hypothetical protein
MYNQTAFGGMLQGIVELTSIVLRPEPLDAKIERRCKRAWEEAPCPDCGETAVQTRDDSPQSGVPTVDTCSRTRETRHSNADDSLLER